MGKKEAKPLVDEMEQQQQQQHHTLLKNNKHFELKISLKNSFWSTESEFE
jgi:hypothetical protein